MPRPHSPRYLAAVDTTSKFGDTHPTVLWRACSGTLPEHHDLDGASEQQLLPLWGNSRGRRQADGDRGGGFDWCCGNTVEAERC